MMIRELKRLEVPRYLTEFSCIGPSCEDDCCTGWKVNVSQSEYEVLTKAYSSGKPQPNKLSQRIEILPCEDGSSGFARMILKQNQKCHFLTEDGLCEIHRDFSEDSLPAVCATYPRMVTRINDRAYVAGTFACPEIVRLCLRSQDPFKIVQQSSLELPRYIRYHFSEHPFDGYIDYYERIQTAILCILNLSTLSLNDQLFVCAYFANCLDPFFKKGQKTVDVDKLDQVIRLTTTPSTATDLAGKFRDLVLPDEISASIGFQMLSLRCRCADIGLAFARLVRDVCSSYVSVPNLPESEKRWELEIPGDILQKLYKERIVTYTRSIGKWLETNLRKYAVNFWLTSPYFLSQSLFINVRRMFVHLAVIRFLLFSQPRIVELMLKKNSKKYSDEQLIETLDNLFVKVVYLFSRSFDHCPKSIEEIDRTLDQEGITSFAHLICLLKY